MSDELDPPAGDNDAAPATASGILTELRLAISFLTILPVIDRRRASEDSVAASFAWFPIVGFVLGAALTAEDWILAHVFAQVIRSVFIIVSLAIVTGAVHLDGLADTADALGAGRERERALEILRDSRVGTFGASAIFFDLMLKILALSTLAGHRRYAALLLAPMLARWAMLLVASGLVYLRACGSGSTLLASKSKNLGRRTTIVAAFTLVVVLTLGAFRTIALASAVAIAIVFAMRWFYRRWLGGVTGDLIGACGELVEIAVLVTMAS
jgi:adenosylcobinamide-GDP ribazoletransferase